MSKEAKRAETICGYPADQVIEDGNCVWLRSGFDGVWCLKHRQLAPELRQLVGVVPCVTRLEDYKRRCVAHDPSTPPEVLAQLAQDEVAGVRAHVAENPSTPPEVLGQLAEDEDDVVRGTVAENPSTPPEVLARFAYNPKPGVSAEVTQNPKAPDATARPDTTRDLPATPSPASAPAPRRLPCPGRAAHRGR